MKFNFDELKLKKQKVINLIGKGLHDEDLDVIIQVLRDENAVVEVLNLNNNKISNEGARSVAHTLAKNKTLKVLNLEKNKIGGEGTTSLAYALAKNTTLEELDLGYNNGGVKGVKLLADALTKNNTLKVLHLNDNNIGDKGAKSLADALTVNTSLEQIYLSFNNIDDEGLKSFASALMVNKSLQMIYLDHNNITGLCELYTYTGYNLHRKISDQGGKKLLDSLKCNNTLNKLDLGYNDISNQLKHDIDTIINDSNRERNELTSDQWREIIAMCDSKEVIVKFMTIKADRERIISKEDNEITKMKDEIAKKDRALTMKDDQIATLKAAIRGQAKQLEMIVDTLDLTNEEGDEPTNNKRPRTEEHAPKSTLAIVHEQNQKIVHVKQEKTAAEISLMNVRGEKEALEQKMELASECKMCFELKDEVALVPCGHIMCSECVGSYTACPTCSAKVESHLRLYKG